MTIYSLTTKLSALRNNGLITYNDYKRLRGALNLEKTIKDIKTEIEKQKEERRFDDDDMFAYITGLDDALYIIDKYTLGSEVNYERIN